MSEKICAYTCITGEYDILHEVKWPEKNVDYLCFTNNKNLKSKTWKIVYIENENLDNHYLSRKIKILGHPIISENYDISIWMDASIIWDKSITDFINTYFKDTSLAAFKHSARSTIREEAITCLLFNKDSKDNIVNTLNFLKTNNYIDNIDLYEMTVFIKKHNDPQVIQTMNIWFDTLRRFSKRDQLSFPYSVWKTKLKVKTINLNVWHNPWFHSIKHTPRPEIQHCSVYYGDPYNNFNFNKHFTYNYNEANNTYSFCTIIPTNTKQIEFYPTNIIGIEFDHINITPSPNNIQIFGDIRQNGQNIFCTNHNTIKATGIFKKNQKMSFSIMLRHISKSDYNNLLEQFWAEKESSHQLISKIKNLESENANLHTQLEAILNSKSWKTIQKIRKITPPYK